MHYKNFAELEASFDSLMRDKNLRRAIRKMSDPFAMIMLNKYALEVTLNWLCNTEQMLDVHNRTLFFTLDGVARDGLLSRYPNLNTVTKHIPCLQETFAPMDSTYMSFFVLRTNLIRTIINYARSIWLLQADTFWRENLFNVPIITDQAAKVFLDQDGYDGVAESRKESMNGANFFVSKSAADLINDLYWYQSRFYVTDPDAMRIVCRKGIAPSGCRFIHHRYHHLLLDPKYQLR
ncbi:unnamed protein product [Gongylonema pulchrum]|uniref:Nucleotid_trans domain-containing protein n=1 Tax=Gongylonema pulchrum TaxID=637853 RepID=A0A183EHJ1_9BILA|nr:unnamed protein product [Gongylonema pulchrum]